MLADGAALGEGQAPDRIGGSIGLEKGGDWKPCPRGEAKGGQGFSVVLAEPVHMTKNRRCWALINSPQVSAR